MSSSLFISKKWTSVLISLFLFIFNQEENIDTKSNCDEDSKNNNNNKNNLIL